MLGDEIDHVSPMFISEHELMHQISFFGISEICLTASVIHSKLKLITNIDFVVTLGPEAEHLTLNFVCKLVLVDSF